MSATNAACTSSSTEGAGALPPDASHYSASVPGTTKLQATPPEPMPARKMATNGADSGTGATVPARSLWRKTLDLSRECKAVPCIRAPLPFSQRTSIESPDLTRNRNWDRSAARFERLVLARVRGVGKGGV